MAHIDYPTDLLKSTALLARIKTKVAADGDDSVLVLMLAKNKINLDNDILEGEKALAYHESFLKTTKVGQNYCEKRNNLLKPLMKHMRGAFQFLKTQFDVNFKEIGEWGGKINNNGRITYPTKTAKMQAMFLKLKEKNDSYSDDESPLLPYLVKQGIDLNVDSTNFAKAVALNTSFEDADKEAGILVEKRNQTWKKPKTNIRKIGAYLMKFYTIENKMLGKYGFVVVSIVKKVKVRNLKVAIGCYAMNKRVAIGDTVGNMGNTDIYLFAGKDITAKRILLLAGKTWIVAKGYSTLSFFNPSTTTIGKVKLTPSFIASKTK